jgi:hypothetical protein
MNAEVAHRITGLAIMGAAVLAYFSRPWSCGLALSQFTSQDAVPYSRFDYHGWGVVTAWFAALIFAPPLLWLASKIFLGRGATFGMFGRGPDTKTTVLSVLIALALAVPMHSQLSYLSGLPIGASVPVLVSSLVWLLVVEIGRTTAVRGHLSKGAVRVASAIALLVTVPKLALIGFTAMNA